MFDIRPCDVSDPQVLGLLAIHLEGMHHNTPPDQVFALDAGGLQDPAVTMLGAWDGTSLAGFAAIKELGPDHGEVKSMRTAPAYLRRGVAAQLLDELLDIASDRGYRLVSLETGTAPAFDAAVALYRRRGFVDGPPYADYAATEFNQFLQLQLSP